MFDSDSQVKAGGAVLFGFIDGEHKKQVTVAHVMSVSPLAEGDGFPLITVVFPQQPFDPRLANGADWQKAFERRASVPHFSTEAVESGAITAWWGEYATPELISDAFEDIPVPEGNPAEMRAAADQARITRDKPGPDFATPAAVQAGQLPAESVQSPAVNEGAIVEPPRTDIPADPNNQPGPTPAIDPLPPSSDFSTGGTDSTPSNTDN